MSRKVCKPFFLTYTLWECQEKCVSFWECQEKCVSFWVRLNFHTSALGFGGNVKKSV